MMSQVLRIATMTLCCFCGLSVRAAVELDWAYHDDADGEDDRGTEVVPGEAFSFVSPDPARISTDDDVTLYVLTANQFAGDEDEEVWVRLWNGTEEYWVQASWVKNITLGEGEDAAGSFHDQPGEGTRMLDLWKVDLEAGKTRPGDNYYVIQLKAGDAVRYLLREEDVEMGGKNNVGQASTAEASAYFGRDWKLGVSGP
jgi:hypothetical protein